MLLGIRITRRKPTTCNKEYNGVGKSFDKRLIHHSISPVMIERASVTQTNQNPLQELYH